MTISVEELKNESKDSYKVILIPDNETDTKTTFITLTNPHPVTGKPTEFIISVPEKNNEGKRSNLYVLDQVNWKNPNVKNQSYTPDGKPYRCLFITGDSDKNATSINEQSALVLGAEPNIYALTPFSPLYLLLSHFKSLLQKQFQDDKQLDTNNHKRLLSYEDLTDSIYEKNKFIELLAKDYNINLKPLLELICDSSSIPSMDSDDDDEDQFFYKISIEKIKKIIIQKVDGLVEMLSLKESFKSLKIRMETMFPNGVPDDIKLLIWRQQAISLLSNYIDQWYIDISVTYNFELLDKFIDEKKEQERAQEMIEESIQQLHEGTAAVLSAQKSKKAKVVKKPTKPKTPPVAVGKGALDMFFKKKT